MSILRLSCLIVFVAAVGWAQDLVPEARAAVLLDQSSGRVLFQKAPDLAIPPASLTKLMTLHLVWKGLAEGKYHPGDPVPVTAETTGAAVPAGSSLMFLEAGQQVTVKDLMLGLAVDSGNDAALTLARFSAGSVPAFVEAMNAEAQALGLTQTHFTDPSGFDARNQTTAGDFSRFCRLYLQLHPQSTEVLHSVRELAFPTEANRAPNDHRPVRTIVQPNRNTLLEAYPGADGLKTGYIDEAGYNLAATAVRNGQRLVAVILGVSGRNTADGTRRRTEAASRLLDYGYQNYPLHELPLPAEPTLRVWFGSPGTVALAPLGPTAYPMNSAEAEGVEVHREGPREVAGALPLGTAVGALVWTKEGREFYRVTLGTAAAVSPAPWWQGLWDRIVLFFRGFTGTPEPRPAAPRTQS